MAESSLLLAFERHWNASGFADSTLENYLQVYAKLTRKGLKLPPDLTLAEAQNYVLSRLKEVKPSSVAFEVKAIKSLSKWSAAYLDVPDPLTDLRIPKLDEPVAQPTATEEDLAKLLQACNNSIGFEAVRDHALISMFAATGARRSEIARLKVSDLDLHEGLVTFHTTKERSGRVVSVEAIAPSLLRYMARRDRHPSRAEDALWLGQKGALGVQGIGFAFARREAQAGVTIGTHAFRRRLAVEWLRRGGSEVALQELLGWTSGAMVRRYTRALLSGLAVEEQRRLFPTTEKRQGARARPTSILRKAGDGR